MAKRSVGKRFFAAAVGSAVVLTGLVGAVLAGPASQAAGEAAPVAAPGQYLSLAGTKLAMRGPQRLLLPVTLPKFTIANMPDGSATKPAAVVQFRWRLCKKPLIGDATELSCFLMATPTQAEGKRAFANVNVNFRNVNGVWEADPVNVPYEPRNMANIGFGMYLSPLALVAAVKANDPNGGYVGTTEFQGNPAANGVEITTTLSSPFDARTITLTTDKQTYAPSDSIRFTAKIAGANFAFATGTQTYTLLSRRPVVRVCNEPIAATFTKAAISFSVGTLSQSLQEQMPALPICLDAVRLPSGGLGTDAAPWTVEPLGITGDIQADSLLSAPLEPGGSVTVNFTLLTNVTLSQAPEVVNAAPDRFTWAQTSLPASLPITIAIPAGGQRVDAQLDPNAQIPADGAGQGSAGGSSGGDSTGASGDAATAPAGSVALGGTLAEAGVDLLRAPLASESGSGKTGGQALSVKISKKPKVGKIFTVTGNLTPKAAGEITLALAYTIEGKEVVVRVRTLPVNSSKTPVKWKLSAASPKGKYKIVASYVPTDATKKGLTVSKTVTLK